MILQLAAVVAISALTGWVTWLHLDRKRVESQLTFELARRGQELWVLQRELAEQRTEFEWSIRRLKWKLEDSATIPQLPAAEPEELDVPEELRQDLAPTVRLEPVPEPVEDSEDPITLTSVTQEQRDQVEQMLRRRTGTHTLGELLRMTGLPPNVLSTALLELRNTGRALVTGDDEGFRWQWVDYPRFLRSVNG